VPHEPFPLPLHAILGSYLICQAKKMFHRTAAHLETRLAYTAAMFNVLIGLDRQLHPDHAFKLSIAEFSL
jgi:hypothetical protein